MKFKYTPDEKIELHTLGAIRLICRDFQSHEAGIPEWIKNSSDAYARNDFPESLRTIFLLIQNPTTKTPGFIGCLDFVGMTTSIIEDDFKHWADPLAATRTSLSKSAVQGGHGNGGKSYMTQLFDDYSMIYSVRNGERNCYGVVGGSLHFGYIPDPEEGRGVSSDNIQDELKEALKSFRKSFKSIMDICPDIVKETQGFTLVHGSSPKGYSKSIPYKSLISDITSHVQMIRTIEMCNVYVLVDGKPFGGNKPLSLPNIKPRQDFREPREIVIPKAITDPETGEEISIPDNGTEQGTLILYTSKTSMRYKNKTRHNIIYKTSLGYIGYVPVPDLDVQSSFRNYIYGTCQLESLEPFKQNDRGPLAVSPLTRAVKAFISNQVQLYSREFESLERRELNQQAKNELSRMNEALDKWKNNLLNDMMQGLWGDSGKIGITDVERLPSGKPSRIEITLTHSMAGLGVSFRPNIRFFNQEGRRIGPVPFQWHSDDTNVALVDDELMVINTFSHGSTTIYAETFDKKLRSNSVTLNVVHIQYIDVLPNEVTVSSGSKFKLDALCTLANRETVTGVYLEWMESNPKVARVSASGMIYAFTPGKCSITAGDDHCQDEAPATIHVSEADGIGEGKERGKGYPKILVSDVDKDPETDKDVIFSSDEPPVTQRPQDSDRNIWWINSSSPIAKLIQNKYGFDSRAWRIYHLERYLDILIQIAHKLSSEETQIFDFDDFVLWWGGKAAEMQAAATDALADFIDTGEYPE